MDRRPWALAALLTISLSLAAGTPASADDPSPSPSGSPSPSPSATPKPLTAQELAAIAAARRAIEASTLLERIDAHRRVAEEERRFLDERIAVVRAERQQVEEQLAALKVREDERRAVLGRVLLQAYKQTQTSTLQRLLESGSLLEAFKHAESLGIIAGQEQAIIEELRVIAAERRRALEVLSAREAELAGLAETVRVKDAALAVLAERGERLLRASAAGRGTDAEVTILRELAKEAERAHEQADAILAEIAARSGVTFTRPAEWVWPANGVVSQEFGPSALHLEPPRTYRGVAYPNFHDAIDIAAPLGAPVVAAARGRVAFVGHLEDGAMVVIIGHDGGTVTMYAHLDDARLRPTVRVGDVVEAGQPIASIGMTGITTGPHLHFNVRRGTEPMDPRIYLPPR